MELTSQCLLSLLLSMSPFPEPPPQGVDPRVAAQPPVTDQPAAQAFDYNAFKLGHVHLKSDPSLLAALDRLYQDSPSFRILLARFATEQPKVILHFEPIEEPSFGMLIIQKTNDNYLITLGVQTKPRRLGLDSAEPWLGLILYGLFEISRKDGVFQVSEHRYLFHRSVESHMWNYQQNLRGELRTAGTEPRLVLTGNGKLLYQSVVLRKRYDNVQLDW
jgi:hypothetical protein